MMTHPARKNGVLIVGGTSHDMDFVRLELLRRLAVYDHLKVDVVADFECPALLAKAGFAIAYTCNVQPSDEATHGVKDLVARGGRLFALHATNALLDFTENGVGARPAAREFMETLGSQFIAHPPMGPFRVDVDDADHPLTSGIEAFETLDELYLAEMRAPVRVLLSTQFSGDAPGFTQRQWPDEVRRPILYVNRIGEGEVAYFNLGHARGHYDAPHRMPYWPHIERGSWNTPAFLDILERGVRWAARIGADMQ